MKLSRLEDMVNEKFANFQQEELANNYLKDIIKNMKSSCFNNLREKFDLKD